MITIPAKDTKKFSQPNLGDTQGNLWGTFNVDLTKNMGRVQVQRVQSVFSEDDAGGFSRPAAFAYFDMNNTGTRVFVAYGQKVFVGGDDPTDTFILDVSTNSPSTANSGDMVVFNGKLYATETAKLKRYAPGAAAWTDITTISGGSGQLCTYKDKLYFVSGKKVLSMNIGETVNSSGIYTLDFTYLSGHISWIRAGSNRIWIGFTKNDGTKGLIFEWDGQSENGWSKNYIIEAQGSCGCAIWNDTPYVLDVEGRLLGFGGSYFQEVARLPIMTSDYLSRGYVTSFTNKLCHFNGIAYISDSILINVNNSISGDTEGMVENFPSGIYQYTKDGGLTHKLSPSISSTSTTSDYGQSIVAGSGAVFDASVSNATKLNNYSSVMFGVNCYDETGSNDFSYINVDVIEKRTGDIEHNRLGYITPPFLESVRVNDVWQKIIIKYRKMFDTADKIVVKYRTEKNIPTVIEDIEWDSATAFTDASALIADLNVGDEIEVLTGNGAGDNAQILSIVDNGSDYTITLDKSIIGVSATNKSTVRFQTWYKLPDIIKNEFQFKELPIPQYNKSTEIQFKVIMNWKNKDNELREVIVVNETEQYAK